MIVEHVADAFCKQFALLISHLQQVKAGEVRRPGEVVVHCFWRYVKLGVDALD